MRGGGLVLVEEVEMGVCLVRIVGLDAHFVARRSKRI
jgi:hypothetical protein